MYIYGGGDRGCGNEDPERNSCIQTDWWRSKSIRENLGIFNINTKRNIRKADYKMLAEWRVSPTSYYITAPPIHMYAPVVCILHLAKSTNYEPPHYEFFQASLVSPFWVQVFSLPPCSPAPSVYDRPSTWDAMFSHPHNTKSKNLVFFVLSFMLSDGKQDD